MKTYTTAYRGRLGQVTNDVIQALTRQQQGTEQLFGDLVFLTTGSQLSIAKLLQHRKENTKSARNKG